MLVEPAHMVGATQHVGWRGLWWHVLHLNTWSMLRNMWGGLGWDVVTCGALEHMVDAMQHVGWGGVKFLHIERKITSVVYSHPPSHYIRKHALGWRRVMFTTRRTQTKLSAVAPMLPHCTVHMLLLKTVSLRFSRMKLNGGRFWDGPIVFQRLHASPHPSLQQAFYGMPPLTSQPFGVTCVLKNCESHDLYPVSQERPAVCEELRVK